MFLGEYTHSLDDKGRLAVPVKFRRQLAEGAVVTRGFDGGLILYPAADWKELATKVASLPLTSESARALSRHILAGAMELDIDKQGRINLPAYLREFAGLKNSAVIAGLYNHIEIWSAAKWNAYQNARGKDAEKIAEELGGLGV